MIMHFLAVVLKMKSNLIQILTRITVEMRTRKERSYGSILPIVAMFPPILVKIFLAIVDLIFQNYINYIKSLIGTM